MMSYCTFIGVLVIIGAIIYVAYLVAKHKSKKQGKKGNEAFKIKGKLETVGILYFFAALLFAGLCVLVEWTDTPEVIKTDVIETLDVTDFVTFIDENDEPLHYVVTFNKDGNKTSKLVHVNESTLECDEKDISICIVTKVTTERTGIVYSSTQTKIKYTFK